MLFATVTVSAWLLERRGICERGLPVARLHHFPWVALSRGKDPAHHVAVGSALVAVEMLEEGSASVRWWIPPLFFSVLHGGFVAGLLQLSLIIGTTAIVRWLSDRQILFSGRLDEPLLSWMKEELTAIMALSAIHSLLNPYGWRLYLEIVDSLSNRFMLETLQEWQPLSMAGLAGRHAMYLAGLIVAMALWYPADRAGSMGHWRRVSRLLVPAHAQYSVLPHRERSLLRRAPV